MAMAMAMAMAMVMAMAMAMIVRVRMIIVIAMIVGTLRAGNRHWAPVGLAALRGLRFED